MHRVPARPFRGALLALAASLLTLSAAPAAQAACHPGPGAWCANANLQNVDLRGRDLTNADFSHANLIGARLDGANLSGAKLNHAKLHRANLAKTKLVSAQLQHADVTFVLLNTADLRHLDASSADFHGSQLPGVDARYARFDDARLGGTNFVGADLSHASFVKATAKGTNFHSVRLNGATFKDADVSGSNYAGSHFSDTTMDGARALHTNFWPSTFKDDAKAHNALYRHLYLHFDAWNTGGTCATFGRPEGDPSTSAGGMVQCHGRQSGDATFGNLGTFYFTADGPHGTTRSFYVGNYPTSDKHLEGTRNTNFGVFDVAKAIGFDVPEVPGPQTQAPGIPGGPLAMVLSYQFRGKGYILRVNGFLPRANVLP